ACVNYVSMVGALNTMSPYPGVRIAGSTRYRPPFYARNCHGLTVGTRNGVVLPGATTRRLLYCPRGVRTRPGRSSWATYTWRDASAARRCAFFWRRGVPVETRTA